MAEHREPGDGRPGRAIGAGRIRDDPLEIDDVVNQRRDVGDRIEERRVTLAGKRPGKRDGAEMRIVPRPEGGNGAGAAWNRRMLEAIGGDTAVVALSAVHWTDGTRFDLAALGARAREVGAVFIVDGTQSVGALPFDPRELRSGCYEGIRKKIREDEP
ncbi:MAG: aminotransferase class V-fold PLP-dependent enzyme, partial [Gemmatimonadetes bacterium]|nr:aminotransferase class V-fold PLP-dependent enzyme [Gemmatimonadota bacterium]